QGWAIRNGTGIELKDTGVLRRDLDGTYELAWIGQLDPDASRPLQFSPAQDQTKPYFAQWQDALTVYAFERQQSDLLNRLDSNKDRMLTREEVGRQDGLSGEFNVADINADGQLDQSELYRWCVASRQGDLTLGRMLELACNAWGLRPGGVRLVGWTDKEFEGLNIRPRASQLMLRTMVLAHLRSGPLVPARPDKNLKAPFDRPEISTWDETGIDETGNGLEAPIR
ncbi:MAG: hypothetical protein JJ992_22815, partial [Planctomycetes bacterium]|nr:hypothetical protein [Planctomycetota bacterium]